MQDVNHQLFTESVKEEILLSMKEKKGKTSLLIIHDIELIYSWCNYVIRIENGRIKEQQSVGQAELF